MSNIEPLSRGGTKQQGKIAYPVEVNHLLSLLNPRTEVRPVIHNGHMNKGTVVIKMENINMSKCMSFLSPKEI